ncbi:uncharacterized protein LODBEIA_P45620 [Lodderomyces beijingensis]|uniref:NADPH-dependent diflavin oxidoreductase 1 n=1 Tax=Lodderomyces beijingensis TaxID=1775926 RepID=A0ABP0ZRM7_9ASCO
MPERITILYGSETGNAEEYAKYLKLRLRACNLRSTVAELDGYPLKQLVTDTDFLIIICSTTGQGELPRNAKSFMKFILKKKLPSDLFHHLKMTSLGLGDSSYTKYNYAVKKIHARMSQLGCQELSPRCEADEMSPEGIDGFYLEWETQLINALVKEFPAARALDGDGDGDGTVPVPVPMPEHKVSLQKDTETNLTTTPKTDSILHEIYSGLQTGEVVLNERVTASDHFQDVRLFRFKSRDLRYHVGDTISLYPCNFDEDVQALLEAQPQWLPIADKPLCIRNLVGHEVRITLRNLLKHHLDIMSIPRRSFFSLVWHFCDNSNEDGQREQDKLKEFGAFDDPEELYNYANRPRRSILETISEFKNNLSIPVSYILDLIPLVKPRVFSIASRPNEDEIEILVAVVEYKTIMRKIRRGVCTRWLRSLKVGEKVDFSLGKSPFTMKKAPVIMVAPGTGVAPMKALIDHELYIKSGREMFLFFGCRFEEKDHLIRDLWKGSTPNLHLFSCFSRDKGAKYKYVQNALIDQHELLGDLIYNQDAIIFVCGSSGKMPREVKLTFVEILKRYCKMGEEEAQKYIIDLEDTGRYKEDVW